MEDARLVEVVKILRPVNLELIQEAISDDDARVKLLKPLKVSDDEFAEYLSQKITFKLGDTSIRKPRRAVIQAVHSCCQSKNVSEEVPRKFVKWYTPRNCDLGCKFCHNAHSRRTWARDSSEGDMRAIAGALADSDKIAGLTFLGGEPTLASGFEDACDELARANFKFGIVTAGHHLAGFPKLYENPNLGFVGLSIDSLDGSVVKAIRGRGVLGDQIEGLELALRRRSELGASYQIYINTVLTKKNYIEMPDMLRHFASIGVNRVKILSYNTRDKGASAASELKLDPEDIVDAARRLGRLHLSEKATWNRSKFQIEYNFLSALAKRYYNSVESFEFPIAGHLCPISRSTVFLSNNGDLYACENFKPYFGMDDNSLLGAAHKIGNILDRGFDAVASAFYLKSTFYTVANSDLYDNLEPCRTCPHLFKECVPCGLKGTKRETTFVNDHCSEYKQRLLDAGIYIGRTDEPIRLAAPLTKQR
jgi:MoaA/NifB/PqqE/SkfB family radical SAM enzyme